MAAWPHHLSSAITMEPLRHLSTQSSANRHNRTPGPTVPTQKGKKEKKEIDCRLYSLPLKPQLLSNIHPPKVCHLILCSSADTARWKDFLFLPFSLPPSHTQPSCSVCRTHSLCCRAEADELKRSLHNFAACQSGFISLWHTPQSLRFSCLSGPCQLQSLPCIFNEAAFVCVGIRVCMCV